MALYSKEKLENMDLKVSSIEMVKEAKCGSYRSWGKGISTETFYVIWEKKVIDFRELEVIGDLNKSHDGWEKKAKVGWVE